MARHFDTDRIPTVYSIEDIPSIEVRPGVHQKVFRGLDCMVGVTTLEPDMEAGPHSHPWEQVAYIEEGSIEFHVGTRSVEMEAGDILYVPPGVEHFAEPNSGWECVNVDVWPLREDYLPRTRYQEEFVMYEE